ncbi:hypothetical protein DHEL01_v203163, partial [Diaporthe helianthi]
TSLEICRTFIFVKPRFPSIAPRLTAASWHIVTDMAPSSKPAAPPYAKDEKVLCFHHDMLYEAKIIEIDSTEEGGFRYKIHYKGWKATWDDWVPQDRIRKLNDENRELAAQLNQQARASMQKKSGPAKKVGLKNGSDFSSARGSEERSGAAATMSGRGRKRDFDLENRALFLTRPNANINTTFAKFDLAFAPSIHLVELEFAQPHSAGYQQALQHTTLAQALQSILHCSIIARSPSPLIHLPNTTTNVVVFTTGAHLLSPLRLRNPKLNNSKRAVLSTALLIIGPHQSYPLNLSL